MTKRDAMVDAIAAVRAYGDGDLPAMAGIVSDANSEGVEALTLLASRLVMVAQFALHGWTRADEEAAERGMFNLAGLAARVTSGAPG